MARTANPNMHIFKTEDRARTHFSKQAKAQLLQCITGIAKGDYFVETILPSTTETAIQCWPKHYRLVDEK